MFTKKTIAFTFAMRLLKVVIHFTDFELQISFNAVGI